MPLHPALEPGRVAVVTGAASGIGLAAAAKFASLGMKVVMADVNAGALELRKRVSRRARPERSTSHLHDRRQRRARRSTRLKDRAFEEFGEVAVLMNNAGVERRRRRVSATRRAGARVIDVNLWGVINGVQVFAPAMIAQSGASAHRQHRLEAGHHPPARRHRLQRLEGRA